MDDAAEAQLDGATHLALCALSKDMHEQVAGLLAAAANQAAMDRHVRRLRRRVMLQRAEIDHLTTKHARLKQAYVEVRRVCGREYSQHARYNVQKVETWRLMREMGKTVDDMAALKRDVRNRAEDDAKDWYDRDEEAEQARLREEARIARVHKADLQRIRSLHYSDDSDLEYSDEDGSIDEARA